MSHPRLERWIAGILIVFFACMATAYSLGPLFEGQDEHSHYRLIRFYQSRRALPGTPWDPDSTDESQQAPLYYVIAALVKSPFDDSDFAQRYPQLKDMRNPSWGIYKQIPGNDNKNFLIHRLYEAFPYAESGTALTFHALRLMSVLFSTVTVITCYAIFRLMWPDNPARRVIALGLVATWPHFTYVSGTVTNDVLLYLLGTVSLYLLLRQMRLGPSWRRAALLGVALGLALITKANAVFLAIPIGIAVVTDRKSWKYAAVTLAIVLALAGWWYVRNLIVFGDLTGWAGFHAHRPDFRMEPGSLTFADWASRIAVTYDYFWARFGLAEIPVGSPIYRAYDVLTALSVGGFVLWLVRTLPAAWKRQIGSTDIRIGAVVAAFTLAWAAALGYVATIERWGVHPRHLYPAMAGWGALAAVGLTTLIPSALRWRASLSAAAVLIVLGATSLFGFFLPSYLPLSLPTRIEHPLSIRYGDAAELIGMDQVNVRARPGERLTIRLYWRAIEPSEETLYAYIHSLDGYVVKRDSYPATGNLHSGDWQPGMTWAEEYIVTIPPDATPQRAYPLIAGLFVLSTKQSLTSSGSAGNEILPVVGQIAINGPQQDFSPAYMWGDSIGMREPEITRQPDSIRVCLSRSTLKSVDSNYQTFIHILDQAGQLIAQDDFAPMDGGYPISAWAAGEVIDECRSIPMKVASSVRVQVAVGLYDLASGERLPMYDASGSPLPDNQVVVTK